MKAKKITNFAAQLGVKLSINSEFMTEKNRRYYLINPDLNAIISRDFFYAGVFLGKAKEDKFFPSFNLLFLLSKEGANRVVVDAKSAWLFICGRDVLVKSILHISVSLKKNMNTLVVNELGECLGFGRFVGNLNSKSDGDEVAVRNIADVGDFLRRER